jgi:two-component system, sporulation sensor kinase E
MERELNKLKQMAAHRPEAAGPRRSRGRWQTDVTDGLESTLKLEDFLGVAKGEISRLDYIVTQFLQAVRPTPLRLQMVSLNEVVRATLELLRPELENRDLTVHEKLARGLPLAPLDAAQIKQVLVNLIKNAMQAMTKGGILTVQTGQGGDGVWVSLSDTGGGIPAEKINRLFEPFYTTREKGTGLGLMIVQRIVREHGGRIEVESRVGQGTTFRVGLPLHEPQPKLLEAKHHD